MSSIPSPALKEGPSLLPSSLCSFPAPPMTETEWMDSKHSLATWFKTLSAGEEKKDEETKTETAPSKEEENACATDYTPVVVLPVIDVPNGEEDEEVLYKHPTNVKLLRFDATTKEWKERGKGEIRILSHAKRPTFPTRLILRQAQTLKIRLNHYLTPHLTLIPNCGSDKAWTWFIFFLTLSFLISVVASFRSAADYADEVLEVSTFALCFRTCEDAVAFKTAFDSAKIK